MTEKYLFDYIRDKKGSNNVALETEDTTLSFSELYTLTLKTADLFASLGVKSGNTVAILMDNSIEFSISVLASSLLCLRIIPLNTKLSSNQIEAQLKELKPDFLVIKDGKGIDYPVKTIELKLEHVKNRPFREEVYLPKCFPDEPFLISTTSGSTSKPKPIVLSMQTKIRRAFLTTIDLYDIKENDTLIVSTPMYHTLGFRLSLIPIYVGCKAVILNRFEPEMWLKVVSDKKVNFAILVSSQIRSLLPYLREKRFDLSHLKCLVSSSSSLNPAEKEEILRLLECDVHEMYGTSETSTATDINLRKHKNKLHSVGYPLKGVDVKILDEEGNLLPPYKIGEIAIKTPLIFSGYLNMEEETKKAFAGDYFLTGDMGYIDEDGFLYYRGRKKFVYKVGAINVFPEDIEKVIMSYNSIMECAVVGAQDKLVAFYTADKHIKESELRKFCFTQLASYQVPYRFIQLEDMPKNSVGKLDRRALEEYLQEGYI